MNKDEILQRIRLLADEMSANEEENQMMEDEITELYEELDAIEERETQ